MCAKYADTDDQVYLPGDHTGTPVPDGRRPWTVNWSGYAPVDITPPVLQPAALAAPEAWITDPVATPTQVTDWPVRLASALVPYQLNAQGWPLNPTGRTGRSGRNLGSWAENAAADPIVVAGESNERRVLLIRRSDTGHWAIPGGMVDPDETAPATLVRELHEETGVDLSRVRPRILARTYVDDPRNTDHAWVATTVGLYTLPDTVPATAGDDAADARWWPWTSVDQLASELGPHGGLYAAHRPLLAAAQTAHA